MTDCESFERKGKGLLLIGDPHFKEDNDLDTNPPVTFILELAQSRRNDLEAIIVMGDILHDHKRSYMRAHMKACDFLLALSTIAPTYLLIGNHDRVDNFDFLSDIHFFHGLTRDTLTVVSKVMTITVNNQTVVLVPYVPAGRFLEALYAYDKTPEWFTSASLICAHQEFNQCILGSNRRSTTGDEWDIQYPPVYSGHIHGAHDYHNIHYVGSMYQVDYSEAANKAVRIVTVGSSISEEVIPLPMRKKVLIQLTQDNFTSFVRDSSANEVLTIHIYCRPGVDLSTHPLVEAWKKAGHTVAQRLIKDDTPGSLDGIAVTSTSFLSKLRERVKDRPEYVTILDRVFGSPSL